MTTMMTNDEKIAEKKKLEASLRNTADELVRALMSAKALKDKDLIDDIERLRDAVVPVRAKLYKKIENHY